MCSLGTVMLSLFVPLNVFLIVALTLECRSIFADFADSLNLGQQEIFGPVQKYENICRETIAPLRNIYKTAIPAQGR